jgi:multiple antibiotic resistance protein
MLLTWYIIRSTSAIYNFMGKTGLDVVAKIMAVFLAAIAVEYMIRGIRSEIGWD